MKKLFNSFLVLVIVLGLLGGAVYGIYRIYKWTTWKNDIIDQHKPGAMFNYTGDEVIVVDFEKQGSKWQVRPVHREAVYRLDWDDIERNYEENELTTKVAKN